MEKIDRDEHCYNDEIDYYNLWLVLKKRKVLIGLITLICLVLTTGYAVMAPREYNLTNNLVLSTADIVPQDVVIAVENIDTIVKRKKEKGEDVLGLPVQDLGNIRRVRVVKTNPVWVEIATLDRSAGIALMKALPRLVQSTPGIVVKLGMQKELLEKNIQDLKAVMDNPLKDMKLPSNAAILVSSFDFYTLREKYNTLNYNMMMIEKGRIVSLASENGPIAESYSPKMKNFMLWGLLFGGGLGFVVAFFAEWAGKTREAKNLN